MNNESELSIKKYYIQFLLNYIIYDYLFKYNNNIIFNII